VGEPGVGRVIGGEEELRVLLEEVFRTRADQQAQQSRRGSNAHELHAARSASLEALEGYAGALTERGWPLPPRMRNDIQLLRSLCGQRGWAPRRTEVPRSG
jgi:hypothetical protein